MMTIIAKNNTAGIITLGDLFSVEIPASGTKNLTELFTLPLISRSEELKTLVSSGNITINDGSSNLNITDSLDHLLLVTKFYVKQQVGAESGWRTGDTPPINPSPGSGWFNSTENVLYQYDGSRGKWLSVDCKIFLFGHEADAKGKFLKLGENNDASTGLLIPKPSTIVRLYGMVKDDAGYIQSDITLRKNYVTNLTTLSFGANERYVNMNLNVDLNGGDIFQIWVENNNNKFDKPNIFVEMVWRPGSAYVPNT